jgi:hypothetical protein
MIAAIPPYEHCKRLYRYNTLRTIKSPDMSEQNMRIKLYLHLGAYIVRNYVAGRSIICYVLRRFLRSY